MGRGAVFLGLILLVPVAAFGGDITLLGQSDHGATIFDVWSQGPHVYAATGHGILILDYADPQNPVETDSVPAQGAHQVVGRDGYLYVAGGSYGLYAFQIVAPGELLLVDHEPLAYVKDVEVGPLSWEPGHVCVLSQNTILDVTLEGNSLVLGERSETGSNLERISTSSSGVSAVSRATFSGMFEWTDLYYWGEGESNHFREWFPAYSDIISVDAHDATRVLLLSSLGPEIYKPGATVPDTTFSPEYELPLRMHHMDFPTESLAGHKLAVIGVEQDGDQEIKDLGRLQIYEVDEDFVLSLEADGTFEFPEQEIGGIHSEPAGPLYLSLKKDGLHRFEVTAEGALSSQSIFRRGGIGSFVGNERVVVAWDENTGWAQFFDVREGVIPLPISVPSIRDAVMTDKSAVLRSAEGFHIYSLGENSIEGGLFVPVPGISDIALEGGTIAVLSGDNGGVVTLYDIGGSPGESIATPLTDITLSENRLVCLGESQSDSVMISWFDIQNINEPQHLGTGGLYIGPVKDFKAFEVYGNHVYGVVHYRSRYGTWQYLAVLDCSDPSAPVGRPGLYEYGAEVTSLSRFSKDALVVTLGGAEPEVRFLNLEDPSNPEEFGALDVPGAERVLHSGNRLYP